MSRATSPTPHRLRRVRLIAVIGLMTLMATACGLRPEGQEVVFNGAQPGTFGSGAGFDADANPLGGGGDNPLGGGEDGGDGDGTDLASGTGSTSGTSGTSPSTGSSSSPSTSSGSTGSSSSSTSRPSGSTGSSSSGSSGAGSTGSGSAGTGSSGAGGSGAGGAGGGGGGGGGGGAGGGGGGAQVTGSDRTGVDAENGVISVAVHAPVTGAAPLPVTSFEQARDLYFRYLLSQQPDIGGFTDIRINFADDRYQPSTAVQACRQLAAENFILVGAGGTDQIQACATFANSSGIPYFSAGVTEAGLNGLPNYFAFSMSYRSQGNLLAQWVGANHGGKKVAAIVTDTANFADAVEGWEAGVGAAGLDYYSTLRHPKGDSSWVNTFANELAQNGVEVVYMNTAPLDYIRFAQQAAQQGYTPQFVGVGVTMGLNAVLNSGCPQVGGGQFFSPFPGLDWARANEPEFFDAANQFGTPSDDIALALWAQGKILAQLLTEYQNTFGSNDVTREDFRNLVEVSTVNTGIFPDLSYSGNDHFGANQVHVLQANCNTGEHETLATFATGF